MNKYIMAMKIIADKNMPMVEELFHNIGDVLLLEGRNITNNSIKDADILLVRSTTNVSAQLLDGTNVRFVGSATSGVDHLDTTYLQSNNIAWCCAAGSNANAVVDYVCAALGALSYKYGEGLEQKTISIIGLGNVGSRLYKKLSGFGLKVVACDPLIMKQYSREYNFVDFHTALHANIISFHVPLVTNGEYPTYKYLNATNMQLLQEGSWIINSARGYVVDGFSMLNNIRIRNLKTVFDVFEHEPLVNIYLANSCDIATPHIAGYSALGRIRGTIEVYKQLMNFLSMDVDHDILNNIGAIKKQDINIEEGTIAEIFNQQAAYTCPINSINKQFKETLVLRENERIMAFDNLRKQYSQRKEAVEFNFN